MIFDTILTWFFNFLYWVVGLFPDFSDSYLGSEGFADLVARAGYFLPMGAIAISVIAIITIHGVMNNIWIFNWILKRIRGG